MYLTDTTVTVTWVLPPQDPIPVEDDFDIRKAPGSWAATYEDAAVTSFTAPTTTVSGLITYEIFLSHPGFLRLYLTVGNADTSAVVAEKRFYVFNDVPLTPYGIKAHAVPLTAPEEAETAPEEAETVAFDIWYDIGGIAEDPRDSSVIWVAGVRNYWDEQGTLVKYNRKTQAVISEQYLPSGKGYSVKGYIIMPNGRHILTDNEPVVENSYRCYYSDNDGATWATSSLGGGDNSDFNGSGGLYYDTVLEGVWWGTDVKTWFSPDGATYYVQQSNSPTDGVIPVGKCKNILRYNTDTLVMCGPSIVGNKRLYYTTASNPPANVLDYTEVTTLEDIWDASYNLVGMMPTPDGDELIMWTDDGHVAKSYSGIADLDIVDHGATLTGTMYQGFSVPDFGKMYVYGSSGWYESLDQGDTWAVSTDSKFTPYAVKRTDKAFNSIAKLLSDNAFAFVDDIDFFQERLVMTI
ncbi:MAG: hypothetical protein GY820_10500 [Gammaproteobacteria bacterium]|nr:hypothetical protein [Gammaproteobacteria bacterium]